MFEPLDDGESYESPAWIPTDGVEQVVAQWFSAGGATVTATLRESNDGVNEDSSQTLGTAGATGPASPTVVRVRTAFVKLRVVVSVANATTLRAGLKAT
jgi:hypothetical protein